MEGEAASPEERVPWIKTNQGVGVCITALIIVLLAYLSRQEWVYRELRDGFQLGFFTVVSAFAMLACAVAMIFDRHKRRSDKEMARLGMVDFIVAFAAAVACYAYFELAWRVDFLLVSPVFLTGGLYTLGVRPVRSAILSGVVTTVVIYTLFRLLGIHLPTNIIPS